MLRLYHEDMRTCAEAEDRGECKMVIFDLDETVFVVESRLRRFLKIDQETIDSSENFANASRTTYLSKAKQYPSEMLDEPSIRKLFLWLINRSKLRELFLRLLTKQIQIAFITAGAYSADILRILGHEFDLPALEQAHFYGPENMPSWDQAVKRWQAEIEEKDSLAVPIPDEAQKGYWVLDVLRDLASEGIEIKPSEVVLVDDKAAYRSTCEELGIDFILADTFNGNSTYLNRLDALLDSMEESHERLVSDSDSSSGDEILPRLSLRGLSLS